MKFRNGVQPIEQSGIGFDNFLNSIIVGIICGGFSYVGYQAELILLFIPTGLVAVMCLLSIIYSVYLFIHSKIKTK
jgi:hypothetical protein